MPLIKREQVPQMERLTVRMEKKLSEDLTAYCAYMDSSRDYVISEAVKYIVYRDKEFAKVDADSASRTASETASERSSESASKTSPTKQQERAAGK